MDSVGGPVSVLSMMIRHFAKTGSQIKRLDLEADLYLQADTDEKRLTDPVADSLS